MDFVYFNKRPTVQTIAQLEALARTLEVDGFDLCVRPGYLVEPATAGDRLAAVVRQLSDGGLSVPLVTAPADFIDPTAAETKALIAAAGAAGVPRLKIGYYYRDGSPYAAQIDTIRRALTAFGELGRRHHVKIMYHTHQGCIGHGAAVLANLLRDQDPAHLGAYLDTGHLWLTREPWADALDMVTPFLSAIGIKDVTCKVAAGRVTNEVLWPPTGEGLVDWPLVMGELKKRNFDGPISVHAQYLKSMDPSTADLGRIAAEVAYLRQLADGV